VADRIKFYLDEHVSKAVTEGLRRRGVDVVTVQELDLQAEEDVQHLEQAARDGRVIFTQDADFLRLHALGHPHRGIVYAHQQTSHLLRHTIPHADPRFTDS
jgi:predicted nuclease of predicted toxin-antitoxin system